MTGGPPQELISQLRRRGLAAPARLLLEAHRPIRPLLSDVATFLGPILAPVLGRHASTLQESLDSDGAYDELLSGLDPAPPAAEDAHAEPG